MKKTALQIIEKAIADSKFPVGQQPSRAEIDSLQEALVNEFNRRYPSSAQKEYCIFQNACAPFNSFKDKADVYASFDDYDIIIELDTFRADQVAKKMFSRVVAYEKSTKRAPHLIYVALLYQGTSSMNLNECLKYFQSGEALVEMLNNGSSFIGYVIGSNIAPIYPVAIENYELDNYTNYLAKRHTEKSVSSYRSALSLVQHNLTGNIGINACIKNLIEESNGSISKNNKTYLRSYLHWRIDNGLN